MPTIKTNELAGAALDLAVAMVDPQCKGLIFKAVNGVMCGVDPEDGRICIYFLPDARSLSAMRARRAISGAGGEYASPYSPSIQWERGGAIIERENIGISPPTSRVHRNGGNSPGWGPSGYWSATTWHAGANGRRSIMLHETSVLIAAMRCFVHSKLGESVEIPEELEQRAAQAAHGGE